MIKRQRGSVVVVIAGIFVALLIAFSTFIKFSTSRQYTTKKLNKVLLAREFSAALASLACHQLKTRDIKTPASKLLENLSKPITAMSAETSEKITFASSLKNVISKLKAANTELSDLTYDVKWLVRKADFQPCLQAYPREKIGVIRIPIVITYKAPASKDTIKEDYVYTLDVKVVANLLPVLSKFTLYVQDAVSGEGADRFNKTHTDACGNLKASTYRPWVLDNGGPEGKFPDRFLEVVKANRGLVYLGGGEIILGIARGWNEPGKFGEGFHLLAEGRGDGLYTTGYLGPMALMNWETGLCNDLADEASIFWWELVKDGFDDMSKTNSIFRLFGTDQNKSPTLVLGDVSARTLCAKTYRENAENFGPLPYAGSDDKFNDYISGESEVFDINSFVSEYQKTAGTLNRDTYNTQFASCLVEEPYNRALGYIITNFKLPRPLESGAIPSSDPLAAFVSGKAGASAHEIPAPFNSIFADLKDLKSMNEFLKKERVEIPGRRTAHNLELTKGQTLLGALQACGLLDKDKLDLNGWVYVKSDETIVLNNSLSLVSHGGIVLEKGNIQVN
ncbi:MAG: hypothetical protein EOM80_15115, partial [Erysipelotrichia bacterium]|nr:hypothetical protein [Erysipelotrichia bacterium]